MKLKLVKGSKKQDRNRDGDDDLENDLDGLFTLPLAEFTNARNTLSAQLKKSGRGADAALVKAMAKPPVSAWAVNQLYWNHRGAFDRLLESGERIHRTQASGKVADMRAAVDLRREALNELSELSTSLLRNAGQNPGQNPSLDIIRRINSTLEAMSIYASRSDAPRPGRLTNDVDPPGFESLASWIPSGGATKEAGGRRLAAGTTSPPTRKSGDANRRRKVTKGDDARRDEETLKAKIAEARVSLQDAKKSLTEARARSQRLEAAQKKADSEGTKAEKLKHEAEEQWRKARIASEDAARRARNVAVEIGEATKALENAERTVDNATKELESLIREAK